MERKRVPYTTPVYISWATVADAIHTLKEAEERLKAKGATDIYLEIGIVYDDPEVTLVGQVLETDEQLARRVADEARYEQQERDRYEKLKEKFGDN